MTGKIIALVAVVIVGTLVGVAVLGGNLPFLSQGGGSDSPSGLFNPNPVSPNAEFQGKTTFEVKPSILANNTSVTDDGNPIVIKYYSEKAQGGYNFIAQSDDGTDGTEDITVGTVDIFWAEVAMASAPVPAVYIDWDATMNAVDDSTVGEPRFLDLDKDNRATYVFPLDLSPTKANADPNLQPTYQWFVKLHGDGDADINSPTAQDSLGQGSVESTIEWDITFDAQPNAYAITTVEVRYNSTGTALVDKGGSWIEIPNDAFAGGFETVFFSDMVAQEDTTNGITSLKHHYCNNAGTCNKVDGSNLLTVGSTGSKKVDIPVTITHNFDATDEGLCVELSIDKIDARNTISENEMTNDAMLNEGTGASSSCTL